MAALAEVAEVLGLKAGRSGLSPIGIADAIERGLSAASVARLARLMAPADPAFKYVMVPRATLARSKGSQRLSSLHSNRISRYARLWSAARLVWQSDEAARSFLWRPHPLLEGRRPIDMARTDLGVQLVEDILARLEHGTAA